MKIFEWFEEQADKVKDTIAGAVDDLGVWMEANLANKLTLGLIDTIENIEEEAIKSATPFIDELLQFEAIPDSVKSYLRSLKVRTAPIQLAALLPLIIGAVFFAVAGALTGWFEQVKQESMKIFHPTLYNPQEAVLALWRGEITQEQYISELRQHGYAKDKTAVLERINHFVPGVQDLIRFTVRDVFRDSVVKKYQYDTGFSEIEEELKEYTQKVGVDTDVLKLYWRAHWELPSITHAFEMLHRGIISETDIRELLKIADFAPYYIDKIVQIAHNPYTRVDVRRMYAAGVLNREQVKKSYKDIGYDEEHAENLTRWTVAESMGAERDLTKSEILKGYKLGKMQRANAEKALIGLGYDGEESKTILDLVDAEAAQDISQREKKVASNLFYYGKISLSAYEQMLNSLGLSEKEKVLTIQETQARIRDKHKNPTKADLTGWMEAGIISLADFQIEMLNLGYSEKHISYYIQEIQQSK